MEVSVNKHEAQTTPSEQNSAPTKSLGVMTQSKRKLITSEQKPATHSLRLYVQANTTMLDDDVTRNTLTTTPAQPQPQNVLQHGKTLLIVS